MVVKTLTAQDMNDFGPSGSKNKTSLFKGSFSGIALQVDNTSIFGEQNQAGTNFIFDWGAGPVILSPGQVFLLGKDDRGRQLSVNGPVRLDIQIFDGLPPSINVIFLQDGEMVFSAKEIGIVRGQSKRGVSITNDEFPVLIGGSSALVKTAIQTDVNGNLIVTPLAGSSWPIKDNKDTRTSVMLSWELQAGTAAAESALVNFAFGTKGGAALTAANNYQVTAGKTLRITSVVCTAIENATTFLARFRIRQAVTVSNASPPIFDAILGSPGGAALAKQASSIVVPCEIDVISAQQITFTWFTDVNTDTVSMTILGYEFTP